MKHTCYQCGKCCTHYYTVYCFCVSGDEYERWKDNDKIMSKLALCADLDGYKIYDAWFSNKTGDELGRCPWLRKLPNQDKYKCRIHDVKPDQCAGWPVEQEQIEQVNGKCNK